MKNIVRALALAGLFSTGAAFAQAPAATEVQRNVNQQQRIEQGLQSGQLTTREAAKLEKGESKVEKMETRANRDGTVTDAERARIQKAQNAESAGIAKLKHNDRVGNPDSASSKRMQADVQRNVNQQKRIEQGTQSGQLTNREVAKLERGQSHVNAAEARAGADGHVGAGEQKAVQKRENHQSKRIHKQKHDAQKAG